MQSSYARGPDESIRSHTLVLIPPKITRSFQGEAVLESMTILGSRLNPSKVDTWDLFHDMDPLGTGLVHQGIPYKFDDPGAKVLVAKSSKPKHSPLILAESELVVVSNEEEEIHYLVHYQNQIYPVAERWFRQIMARHSGKLEWQGPLDRMLCSHLRDSDRQVRKQACLLLLTLYEPMLTGLARKTFGKDEASLTDALQAVRTSFLSTCTVIDSTKGCGRYVGAMMRNQCSDMINRHRKERTSIGSGVSEPCEPNHGIVRIDDDDEIRRYRDVLAAALRQGVITHCDHSMLEAKFAKDLTLFQIAEAFDLSPEADYQGRVAIARRRIKRAVQALHQFQRDRNPAKEA